MSYGKLLAASVVLALSIGVGWLWSNNLVLTINMAIEPRLEFTPYSPSGAAFLGGYIEPPSYPTLAMVVGLGCLAGFSFGIGHIVGARRRERGGIGSGREW